jgi:hypothetical protein
MLTIQKIERGQRERESKVRENLFLHSYLGQCHIKQMYIKICKHVSN